MVSSAFMQQLRGEEQPGSGAVAPPWHPDADAWPPLAPAAAPSRPAPPAAAPLEARKLTPEERRRVAFETRVAALGFTLHTLVQLQHMACPWHERWQRLVSIPYTAAQVAYPLLASGRTYLDYHDAFHWTFKMGFFTFPLLRRARGVQRVLDAVPSPGLSGFIIDLVKMAWGSRLVAVLCSGVGTPLSSVGAQLAIQAFCVAMVRGNESLCASALLGHPTTVARLRAFTAISFDALMPAFGMGALVAGRECAFVFTLLHLLLGVVAPTLPLILATPTVKGLDRRGRAGAVWLGLCAVWATAALITLWTDAL